MAVSGAWKARRTAAYVELPTPPLRIDPTHGQAMAADPTAGAWGAPSVSSVDPTPAPYMWEPPQDWVAGEAGGLVLDVTPEGHTTDAADYGSSRKANYGAPPLQFADERYVSVRFDGVAPIALNPLVTIRGRNGLVENNPEGNVRLGEIEQHWVDRKFYVGERVHDERIVTPNSPFVTPNAPVPDGAGPYNSPFSSLARMITNVNAKPMMRREQPAVDQSIMTDGSGQLVDAYGSGADWVAG